MKNKYAVIDGEGRYAYGAIKPFDTYGEAADVLARLGSEKGRLLTLHEGKKSP